MRMRIVGFSFIYSWYILSRFQFQFHLSSRGALTQIGCPPSLLVFHNSHTGGREDLGGHWGRMGGRLTDTDDLSLYKSSPFQLLNLCLLRVSFVIM